MKSPDASRMDFCVFGLLKRALASRPVTLSVASGKPVRRSGSRFPFLYFNGASYNRNYGSGLLPGYMVLTSKATDGGSVVFHKVGETSKSDTYRRINLLYIRIKVISATYLIIGPFLYLQYSLK